jgi:uncharacterized protein YndB with AHSA1/START domain
MTAAPSSISLTRNIRASASDLYKAWTEPVVMRRWLANVVEADVQVGGAYRLEIHLPDGSLRELSGTYRVLEPATRIVQTYSDIDVLPGRHVDEQLEITFRALAPAVTEITVVHGWSGQPMTDSERKALQHMWSGWLDRLVEGVELPSTLDG